jgi:cephalosporin-C deacetylase-like acetyl esterase
VSFSDYWANNYQSVKMMNPRFPFILRDITEEGVDPYAIVKYGGWVHFCCVFA